MTKLYGLGTALITPFTPEGKVNFEALDRLLDRQLSGQIDYIVVLGTTGEAVTLSGEEHEQVRNHVVRRTNNQIPLVLGVGGNCTATVCEKLHAMHDELLENYAAILSVCPYYNKPSQEGLFRHFCAVAEASPVPVILYNVPGRTCVNLLPETVMRIYEAHPDKIMGIKEASGNVEQIKRLMDEGRKANADLLVISGDDGIARELMEAGADFHRIVHEKDAALQAHYANMIRLLFCEGNPSGIKTVLAKQGVIANVLRLPLVPNSVAVQNEIQEELIRLSK